MLRATAGCAASSRGRSSTTQPSLSGTGAATRRLCAAAAAACACVPAECRVWNAYFTRALVSVVLALLCNVLVMLCNLLVMLCMPDPRKAPTHTSYTSLSLVRAARRRYMRLDVDSFLLAPLPEDPFAALVARGAKYGYIATGSAPRRAVAARPWGWRLWLLAFDRPVLTTLATLDHFGNTQGWRRASSRFTSGGTSHTSRAAAGSPRACRTSSRMASGTGASSTPTSRSRASNCGAAATTECAPRPATLPRHARRAAAHTASGRRARACQARRRALHPLPPPLSAAGARGAGDFRRAGQRGRFLPPPLGGRPRSPPSGAPTARALSGPEAGLNIPKRARTRAAARVARGSQARGCGAGGASAGARGVCETRQRPVLAPDACAALAANGFPKPKAAMYTS